VEGLQPVGAPEGPSPKPGWLAALASNRRLYLTGLPFAARGWALWVRLTSFPTAWRFVAGAPRSSGVALAWASPGELFLTSPARKEVTDGGQIHRYGGIGN